MKKIETTIVATLALLAFACSGTPGQEVTESEGTASPESEPAPLDPAAAIEVETEHVAEVALPNGNALTFHVAEGVGESLVGELGDSSPLIDMSADESALALFLRVTDESVAVPDALASAEPELFLASGRANTANAQLDLAASDAFISSLASQQALPKAHAACNTSSGRQYFIDNYCGDRSDDDCDPSAEPFHSSQSDSKIKRAHSTSILCDGSQADARFYYWEGGLINQWMYIGQKPIVNNTVGSWRFTGGSKRYRRIEHDAQLGFIRAYSYFD